jgi:hypothetical protein
MSIIFNNDVLEIAISSLDMRMIMDEGNRSTINEAFLFDSSTNKKDSLMVLPFRITVSVRRSIVRLSDDNITNLNECKLSADPMTGSDVDRTLGLNALEMELDIENIQHSGLMTATNLHAIGIVYDYGIDTVYNSYISVDQVAVVGGFSTIDWKAMVGKGPEAKRTPVKLPQAQVTGFNVSVTYKGKILSTNETNIIVAPFKGDQETDTDEILRHVTSTIMTKVPSFISNAEILGINVTDSVASSAGRTLLATTTVTGSIAGSIVGVVAIDVVKGAVASGKSARGVTKDDAYHFGDFTRGVVRSIQEAPKAGISGTAKSVGSYTTENKSRLAGAGGSSLGMMVGTAVAGPIGLIAGAYLGGVLGSKAVEDQEETATNSHRIEYPGMKSLAPDQINLIETSSARSNVDHLTARPTQQYNPPSFHPSSSAQYANSGLASESSFGRMNQDLGSASTQSNSTRSMGVLTSSDFSKTTEFDPLSIFDMPVKNDNQDLAQPSRTSDPFYDPFFDEVSLSSNSCSTYRINPPEASQASTTYGNTPGHYTNASVSQATFHQYPGTESSSSSINVAAASSQSSFYSARSFENTSQSSMSFNQSAFSQDTGMRSMTRHTIMNDTTQSSFHSTIPSENYMQPHSNNNLTPHLVSSYPGMTSSASSLISNRSNPNIGGSTGVVRTPTGSVPPAESSNQPYRFGDLTRSVIAKGKEKSGRDPKDGYKFGDFTRGLFG